MTDRLDALAPVEVLCHAIDYLHEAIVMGVSLDANRLREVLIALLSIEVAMVEGRDFYKRKGGNDVES